MTHHLCQALQGLVDKNTQLVLAVNSIAHWASASEEKMQGLVDSGVFPALRAAFLESKFEAPHAAIGQCLSIFARHSRFRDLVGARFGFVRHAVARVLVIHQQIGLPTLDGSSQSAQQRANDVTNWDADRANMLSSLQADTSARSTAASRASCVRTWALLHQLWFGNAVPTLPLTCDSIRAVAAQMKSAGTAAS